MGSILINVPNLADRELIYNEAETRQILKFFWPNDARRLAQTALIAAIDGTYAMSYLDKLIKSVTRPGKGIGELAKRLARNFTRHWWKHTRPQDLKDVRIYEPIRQGVAVSILKTRLGELKNGVALKPGGSTFYVHAQPVPRILWS